MKATLIFLSFLFATVFSVMGNDRHQRIGVSSLLKRPRVERRVPENFDLSWAAHDPVYHRCVANKCCNDEKCCPGGSVSSKTCSQCRTKCEQSNNCTLGDRAMNTTCLLRAAQIELLRGARVSGETRGIKEQLYQAIMNELENYF